MSLFNDLVVKLERRIQQERIGAVPLIEISQEWERRAWLQVAAVGALGCAVLGLVWYHPEPIIPVVPGQFNALYEWRFAPDWPSLLVIGGFTVLMAVVSFGNCARKAAEEQAAMGDTKARVSAAADERKAVRVAEATRAQDLLYEEAVAHRRSVIELRNNLLSHMERGIRDVLIEARKRQLQIEWIPQSSEAGIHETIRENIRRSRVPEFGILHRSIDQTVLEVLNPDRSCLPPEPTEELLARRHLPPVKRILIIEG